MKRSKFMLLLIIVVSLLYAGCLGGGGGTPGQTYSVGGTVIDGNNQPLSGIKVLIAFDGGKDDTETNSAGKYSFSGVKGQSELTLAKQDGFKSEPKIHKTNKTTSNANFVLHAVQQYDEEVILPASKQISYEDVHLDFSGTDLASDTKIVVKSAEQPPMGDMVAAGPILDIEVSADFTGVVEASFVTEDKSAGLFHYDELNACWNPIIFSEYVNGEIKAKLSHFSVYGIFTAPESAKPTSSANSGQYSPNKEISLSGNRIYYTLDGSLPNNQSNIYSKPFILKEQNLFIRAVNVEANKKPSAVVEFVYNIEQTATYVSGPRFATILGHVGRYFSFETGETMEDSEGADLYLSATNYGGEYFQFAFHQTKAMRFAAPKIESKADFEENFSFFRTVDASHWNEEEADSVTSQLSAYDTLLIRTNQGRLVKVLIVQARGVWQDVDSTLGRGIPELDLVYMFLDEIDLEPPVLETITIETKDGQKFTVPATGDIIEITVSGEPDLMHLTFDEIVYNNRGFMVTYPNSSWPPMNWDAYARPGSKLGPNDLSLLFSGAARYLSADNPYSPWTSFELTAGDDTYWQSKEGEYFFDHGFYFSDVMGNRWTELPFEKIIVNME